MKRNLGENDEHTEELRDKRLAIGRTEIKATLSGLVSIPRYGVEPSGNETPLGSEGLGEIMESGGGD